MLIWNTAFQCALCEENYDYINLHLNDNSSQIHQSIVFKLWDHKTNICSYSLIAKILELLDILSLIFFRKSSIPQYQSFWYNLYFCFWFWFQKPRMCCQNNTVLVWIIWTPSDWSLMPNKYIHFKISCDFLKWFQPSVCRQCHRCCPVLIEDLNYCILIRSISWYLHSIMFVYKITILTYMCINFILLEIICIHNTEGV